MTVELTNDALRLDTVWPQADYERYQREMLPETRQCSGMAAAPAPLAATVAASVTIPPEVPRVMARAGMAMDSADFPRWIDAAARPAPG